MTPGYKRSPIIGVMGSGRASCYDTLGYQLGQALAVAGYVVLTGGGSGMMLAVSQGAAEAGGLVVGVLPSQGPDDPHYQGYPNGYVHVPIYTGMSLARNAINVLSSDVVVALPGGPGTLSEVALALNAGRHVVILGWDEVVLPESCPLSLVHRVADVTETLQTITKILAGGN
jgi:uncharacterized protein (TIGR00725 family)